MSDNNEKIIVEVDGDKAVDGFSRIRQAASDANTALNATAPAVDNAQSAIDKLLGVGRRAAEGLAKTAEAAKDAAGGIEKAGDAADKSKSKFDDLMKSLFSSVRRTGAFIWDMASDGFRMAMGFAESFIDRIAEVQRTISLLSAIPGANIGEQFSYLTGVANKYGLSLQSIQADYAKYVLSAQSSSLTNEQVRRSFEQVAMATRTLHMNAQQTQFTFLALEQMLSKGQVSLQELRRQFSERIPGAMQMMAREMGVTMPVLLQFITKVGAASDKIIPVLGDALQRVYGSGIRNAAQALDAELNRIHTSVTIFFKNVLEAGGAEGMSNLLKTINGLLQTDTIAQVFADAMNKITTNIAMFLKTLTPDDITKFAKVALDFLTSLSVLAMAAAKAVIYLGQHMGLVGAAFGAVFGAQLGMVAGPWGAAIGALVGAVGGYVGGTKLGGAGGKDYDAKMDEYGKVNAEIADIQKKLDVQAESQKSAGFFGKMFAPDTSFAKGRLKILQDQRDALTSDINQMDRDRYSVTHTGDGNGPDLPQLGEQGKMLTGSVASQLAELKKRYGISNGEPTKAEIALAKRQDNFLASLEAELNSLLHPEDDHYESKVAQMQRDGITSGPKYDKAMSLIGQLQDYYNTKKQQESDKKTQGIETQYANMKETTTSDIAKFMDKYDVTNLQQVDDQAWATKARKMSTELDAALVEIQKKMKERANLNPLYMMAHPDIEGEVEAMRAAGDAYINEFKRIEAEKKTALGGTKSFLMEWNASVNDFGSITKNFLKGVTDGIVDMLTNMVMTGKFSFSELTKYVLGYIAKMLIVQAITPFVNAAAGFMSSGLSGLLNIGTSMTSSTPIGSFDMPHRAAGGPVWPGEKFMVGERGPEVVTFDRPGYVHPNESLRGGSGSNTSIQINIDASGNTSARGDTGLQGLARRITDAVRTVIVEEKRPGGMLAS